MVISKKRTRALKPNPIYKPAQYGGKAPTATLVFAFFPSVAFVRLRQAANTLLPLFTLPSVDWLLWWWKQDWSPRSCVSYATFA